MILPCTKPITWSNENNIKSVIRKPFAIWLVLSPVHFPTPAHHTIMCLFYMLGLKEISNRLFNIMEMSFQIP